MKKKRHTTFLWGCLALCAFFCSTGSLLAQQTVRHVLPVARATVNFRELAEQERLMPRSVFVMQAPAPNEGEEENMEDNSGPASPYQPTLVANQVQVPSPNPVLSYQGAPDEAQGGGTAGTFNIPPDTYGATGLDKVFVTVNNNYKVLNKSTGAQISLVSMPSFWSALGTDGAGAFDPRVVYDPYNNRWIHAAVSNGGAAGSRVLLALSRTHDPSGAYDLYAFDPDPGTANWADFPMLGFNKNWVAISVNLFTVGPNANAGTNIFVIDYPALRTGTATSTKFVPSTGFCHYPVESYSDTVNTLYVPSHIGSGAATYRLSTITGTPATPVFTLGATLTRTGGGWAQPSGNVGPQQCLIAPCPGTLTLLDVGDAFIRGNAVFRNGEIWYAQAVGLPTGIFARVATQWTRLNTAGTMLDGGRIDDATATGTNGGRWYTYPSLSVNKNSDVLAGFSKLESDGYAGAAYAMRLGTDAAGTMQDPVVFKDGEDYYDKASSGRTRWGDYSHVTIDPLDDISFWTWQEYARPRAAPTVFSTTAKWGTWVAKVSPNPCLSGVASGNWNTAATWGCGGVPTATSDVSIVSGHNVTLDVNPLARTITVNEGGTLTINAARTLSCKLIVYGTLNITGGTLTLGNNDVFLARNATLTGGSATSFFITNGTGKVSKMIGAGTSFEFPLSANGTSYNGLVVALAAGDPEEVISTRVATGVNPTAGANDPFFVQRTWNIEEMTTGNNNATLTFKWTSADHGASFTAASANAFRNNGSAWSFVTTMSAPALAAGIYSSTTTTAITSFSPWSVSGTSIFPVKFEYFTGSKQGNDHVLNWKLNCDPTTSHFTVERSADAQNFNALGTVALANDCRLPFSFTDAAPVGGRNYYRIRVNDNSGRTSYSKIVLLLNQVEGMEITGLFPNPVNT
ncbi:MAG: G8 domain-containing protein, partial [Dinghuibacter sp.]|nr:G8 domain-containing protein [Dinghuibacter sp.]